MPTDWRESLGKAGHGFDWTEQWMLFEREWNNGV